MSLPWVVETLRGSFCCGVMGWPWRMPRPSASSQLSQVLTRRVTAVSCGKPLLRSEGAPVWRPRNKLTLGQEVFCGCRGLLPIGWRRIGAGSKAAICQGTSGRKSSGAGVGVKGFTGGIAGRGLVRAFLALALLLAPLVTPVHSAQEEVARSHRLHGRGGPPQPWGMGCKTGKGSCFVLHGQGGDKDRDGDQSPSMTER